MVDFPLLLLGLIWIGGLFYGFLIWAHENRDDLVMSVVISSINGASITVSSELYKVLCSAIVQWENHKFESEQEFSYIFKVFFFEFLNSYITVVYYATVEQDPFKLATSVGSIVITRG